MIRSCWVAGYLHGQGNRNQLYYNVYVGSILLVSWYDSPDSIHADLSHASARLGTFNLGLGTINLGLGTINLGIGISNLGIGIFNPGLVTFNPGLGTFNPGLGTFNL